MATYRYDHGRPAGKHDAMRYAGENRAVQRKLKIQQVAKRVSSATQSLLLDRGEKQSEM